MDFIIANDTYDMKAAVQGLNLKQKQRKALDEPSRLERALRGKYNSFMNEHKRDIDEYVRKRQAAVIAEDSIAVIGIDTHYEKLRDDVARALQWKEAADTMYKSRVAGIYLKPKHEWWAYLIDEELEQEAKDEEKGRIIVRGAGF